MKKKHNVLGFLVILEASEYLDQLMAWLECGNYHLMTENDWQQLQALANRCAFLGAEEEIRLAAIIAKNPYKKENGDN